MRSLEVSLQSLFGHTHCGRSVCLRRLRVRCRAGVIDVCEDGLFSGDSRMAGSQRARSGVTPSGLAVRGVNRVHVISLLPRGT